MGECLQAYYSNRSIVPVRYEVLSISAGAVVVLMRSSINFRTTTLILRDIYIIRGKLVIRRVVRENCSMYRHVKCQSQSGSPVR